MRAVLALLLLGCLGFPARADQFDEWCGQVTLPSSLAICSDPGLLDLTRERQQAYDGARARVGEAGASTLLADQKAWVASYPKACGLAADVPPQVPLAPQVRECMSRAGRDRIAYLRAYGASAASPPSTAPTTDRIGPSFDCAKATAPLALLICADAALSKVDLGFNQAYQALRQVLDPAGQRRLQEEDIEFLNSVLKACGIPETGAAAGSSECVAAHYNRKRSEWIARLSGPAREEANRAIEQHVALQADLQRLGLLPPAVRIDGVYGPATRSAISAWQSARGRPSTGVMSDADAAGFAAPEPTLTGGVAPVSQPTSVTAAAPRPFSSTARSQTDEVRLKPRGGTYRVPVRINDAITLDFTLDSGASEVLIPADVLMTLIRTETLSKSDFLGERTYVLADGSKLPSERINLRELQVAGHRLTNVIAGVGPATSDPLLGKSFLSRFKSWTFDNDRHVLVLSMSTQQPTVAPAAPSDHSPTAQGPNEPGTFERFPVVAAYRDTPVMPDFDGRDREFKNYRTRIRNGIAEGADFAGRYKVIQFGCGTGCSFVLLADVSTGRVYGFPHGGENDQMLRLEYRITSNLIRASWVPNIQDMNTCAQEDLLWDDGRFTSLRTAGAAPCPN